MSDEELRAAERAGGPTAIFGSAERFAWRKAMVRAEQQDELWLERGDRVRTLAAKVARWARPEMDHHPQEIEVRITGNGVVDGFVDGDGFVVRLDVNPFASLPEKVNDFRRSLDHYSADWSRDQLVLLAPVAPYSSRTPFRPLTRLELHAACALGGARFSPGSSPKRIARTILAQVKERKISDKQAAVLWSLCWSYRKSIHDKEVSEEAELRHVRACGIGCKHASRVARLDVLVERRLANGSV